ncbi:threonine/serine dehydratase [Pontibacter sp. G13]|uniref:threonine/serine dehydratase n=1 Tax=Pontibacter sp. G13 TaxID=3074898 RepID=UPI002888F993|nr:threonine/serine dehydratase [Pontibacter sp. G13]WNJ16639.1 threonine/serine dehydratase [Pontibacter sp. G13]
MNVHRQVQLAEQRIRPYILKTPVEYSPWLSRDTGAEVWLKLEHIQTTGSFKLRGAANHILSASEEARNRGLITASTGNHGSAFAYMCHKLGVPGTIYLPNGTAQSKIDYMRMYGVELKFIGTDPLESELAAREASAQTGKSFISPYNDEAVVAGQGTMGLELFAQLPDLSTVFVPVGGGGLISGTAGYLKGARPGIEIIGCSPEKSPAMHRSLEAGEIIEVATYPTWSDGTAGGLEPGSITFDLCQKYVDRMELVSEEDIQAALRYLLEKHQWMVEGAAGLALATFRRIAAEYRDKQVVLVLCGRKLGIDRLRELIRD